MKIAIQIISASLVFDEQLRDMGTWAFLKAAQEFAQNLGLTVERSGENLKFLDKNGSLIGEVLIKIKD